MIKLSELRIGNLVLDSTKNIHKIERLDEKWDFSDRYPIPITQKWFLAFGFAKVGFRFEKDNLRIYPQTEGYFEFMKLHVFQDEEFDEHVYVLISNIKYVHQLQNLYFALTGEELVFSSTEP